MAGVLFQHCLVSIVNTIVNRSLDGSYCRLCLGSSGYRSIYWTRRGLARSRNQTPWMFLPLRQGAVAVAVGLWWYSPFVLNRHVTCVIWIWVMITDARNANGRRLSEAHASISPMFGCKDLCEDTCQLLTIYLQHRQTSPKCLILPSA